MLVDGTHYRSIWIDDAERVCIIDQTRLPHEFKIRELRNLKDAAEAIRNMRVRGAPLIGATAAWGIWLGLRDPEQTPLDGILDLLLGTRPTAVNLRTVVDEMRAALSPLPGSEQARRARLLAQEICDRDVQVNEAIGRHGLAVLRDLAHSSSGPLNILTHCNAGWLATVDWGTATAPIYAAHAEGMPVHVWVDETRPRNQGALTAWELAQAGVPHTYITDNAGGHLMQHGKVDVCIVGTDRTTASGAVANKIGTYLKALAARDNDIPFYVALPSSTIDWNIHDSGEIPIEERDTREVTTVYGRTDNDRDETVRVVPAQTPAANYGFDVTPARLITGLITERGVCGATHEELVRLFPETVENRDEKQRHG